MRRTLKPALGAETLGAESSSAVGLQGLHAGNKTACSGGVSYHKLFIVDWFDMREKHYSLCYLKKNDV